MGSDRNCHFSGEFWTVTKYSDLSEYFKRSKLYRFTAHVSKHRHKRSIGTFETLSLKLPDFDCALFAFVAAFDGRNLIKIFGTLCGSVNLFKTSWRIINFSCENRCQKLLASCTKWEEARVPTFNYRDILKIESFRILDSCYCILKKDLLEEKFLKELFDVKNIFERCLIFENLRRMFWKDDRKI